MSAAIKKVEQVTSLQNFARMMIKRRKKTTTTTRFYGLIRRMLSPSCWIGVCVCVQMRRSAEAHAAHWIRLADGERAGLITSV